MSSKELKRLGILSNSKQRSERRGEGCENRRSNLRGGWTGEVIWFEGVLLTIRTKGMSSTQIISSHLAKKCVRCRGEGSFRKCKDVLHTCAHAMKELLAGSALPSPYLPPRCCTWSRWPRGPQCRTPQWQSPSRSTTEQ